MKFPTAMTPLERRIVVLVCVGMSNREIASTAETTEQVVKNYSRQIYRKLGVRNRVNLVIRMMKFKYEGA